MPTIHIGWCNENEFQLVPQEQANFDTVETAEKYVGHMNALEREKRSNDEWFVMVGEAQCLKPCADCDPSFDLHHWLYDAVDDDEAEEGEDAYPDGRMNCKHCDAWRTVVDSDE